MVTQVKPNDPAKSGDEIPDFFYSRGDDEDIARFCAIGLGVDGDNYPGLENIPEPAGTEYSHLRSSIIFDNGLDMFLSRK